MTVTEKETSRRPLKSRDTGWAKAFAAALARKRVTPNSISVTSVFLSAGSAAALFVSGQNLVRHRWIWLLAAAAFIQLRLLCNLLDGMVAVEGGMKTKSGEVFNDLPDRIADSLIFIATGYAAAGLPYGFALGWSAAL